MADRPPRSPARPRSSGRGSISRRSLLRAAGASTLAATAGCLDTVLGSSPRRIEPEEPSEPRAGTPGEFYYFLEANDVVVASLTLDADQLILEYESAATAETESIDEMGVVVDVYNAILVGNGTDVELLIAENLDPFDGQAHGWGVQTEWLEAYNDGNADATMLWGNVLSSRVDERGDQLETLDVEAATEDDDGADHDADVD